MDRPVVAHRRARLRELIERRFGGRQVASSITCSPGAGPCPGFQADHIVPLCMGGPDLADNLQWLADDEHRAKTRTDAANCRMSKNFTVWY